MSADSFDSIYTDNLQSTFDRRRRLQPTSGENSSNNNISNSRSSSHGSALLSSNGGNDNIDTSDGGSNAWQRRTPYGGREGPSGGANASFSLLPRSSSQGVQVPGATSPSSAMPRSSSILDSLYNNNEDMNIDDAVSSFITKPGAKDTGFSGRSAPVVIRRIAPSQKQQREDEDAMLQRLASDRGLEETSVMPYVPETTVEWLMYMLMKYIKLIMMGTHEGDLKTLPFTIMAPRILFVFVMTVAIYMPTIYDVANKPPMWDYSHTRSLKNRDCIMNLYIEKFKPNEFNYDHFTPKKPKNGKAFTKAELSFQPPLEIVNGTFRTKHQVKVVKRFIEAVANSYRKNVTISQHLMFTNVRDSGHLAEKALQHWPPRGTYRTQVHIIAADPDPENDDPEMAGLGYGKLDAIEERFKNHVFKDQFHVYDRIGLAGLPGDDDEVGMDVDIYDEDFGRDPSTYNVTEGEDGEMWEDYWEDVEEEVLDENGSNVTVTTRVKKRRRRRKKTVNRKKRHRMPYPDMQTFFPPDETNTMVPIFHVDGMVMEEQIEILDAARPLFMRQLIGSALVEHSIDMDIRALIGWFNSVNYKTFFLGARQVHRLDHLCPEMLDDILKHPYVNRHPPLPRVEKVIKTVVDFVLGEEEDPLAKQLYPSFFVAMPRGRYKREDMTIQHMYDLFGGLDGGGGQIKTANDRKVPGK
jgi:hypothetical protein